MNNMKRCNLVISTITAVLGVVIMISASKLSLEITSAGPEPGFWPFLLGAILAAVAVILCITSLVNGKKLEEIPVTLNATGNKMVYIMMGVIAIFCVLLSLLGFYIAALLYIPVTMYLLKVRSKKKIILTTVIIVAAVYIIFELLLKTTLPQPFFME